MKMYKITTVYGKTYWARTQADAKTISKRVGSKWDQIDVPTDHAGLCDFLNQQVGSVVKQDEPAAPAVEPVTAVVSADIERKFAPAKSESEERFERSLSIDEILEEADYHQASSIQYRATQRMVDIKVKENTQ
jgi:hypothetical protein